MKTLLLFLFLFSSTVHAGSVQSVRVNNSDVIFQSRQGTAVVSGVKNDWQRKDLTADDTDGVGTQTIAGLGFSNLEIGKIYEYQHQCQVRNPTGLARSQLKVVHNGADIAISRRDTNFASDTTRGQFKNHVIFEALTDTVGVTFQVFSGSITLEGAITGACFAILKERNDLNLETNKFN